jgi:hypothetical protein
MILVSEIKELGFELIDTVGNQEWYSYEAESGIVIVEVTEYGNAVRLFISELNYKAEAQLKGEVTIERIENLIKALS